MISRRAAAFLVVLLAASGMSVPAGWAVDTEVVILPNPVVLRLATSEAISEGAVTRLLDALFEAPAKPRYALSRVGSGLARERFVASASDGAFTGTDTRVVLSGTPFTVVEDAALQAVGVTVERMPVHVAANAILTTGPSIGPEGFGTERVGDGGFLEAGAPEPLEGPNAEIGASTFSLPWANAAAMYLEVSQSNANWWSEPGLMAAWGFELDGANGTWRRPGSEHYLVGVDGYPKFAPRYEPSASNYWVQEALRRAAPAVWDDAFRLAGVPASASSSESFLGRSASAWLARGVDEQIRHLADPSGRDRGLSDPTIRGSMTAAPRWALAVLEDRYPTLRAKRWVARLRNGAGEWVLPTSAAISAAVAAGGEEPLYALGNPVPGAYPLTWVESLYVPSRGLTIDETNAVAALVRLLVTDGQEMVRADGDGVISPAIRATALAALDRAVTSNCETADGVVVVTDQSPYRPPASVAPQMHALGARPWCGTVRAVCDATATVTTTPPGPTTPTAGEGSSDAALLIDQWRVDACQPPYSLAVAYQATGSSEGRRSFWQRTVDFAVTDVPYQPGESAPELGSYRYVPLTAGALGFMFNLRTPDGDRVVSLRLDARTACRIFTEPFLSRPLSWNDPALVALNPGVALPAQPIVPVVRSDGSGSTYVFSEWCIASAPEVWAAFRVAVSGPEVASAAGLPVTQWPEDARLIRVPQPTGVASTVSAVAGSITYVEAAYGGIAGLPLARVRNGTGAFVAPTPSGVTAALDSTSLAPDGTLRRGGETVNSFAYEPVTYSYMLVPTTGIEPGKARALSEFLYYAMTQGQARTEPLGYAPLPPLLRTAALETAAALPGASSFDEWARRVGLAPAPPPVIPDASLPVLLAICGALLLLVVARRPAPRH